MNDTIAVAVYPQPVEALPAILHALGGAGRPAGVLRCEALTGERAGLLIEWDPRCSGAPVVMGIIDIELRRFNGSRLVEFAAPVSIEMQALIASQGLQTSDLTPDRILDVLIDG